MAVTISGYRVNETIHESRNSLIFRAAREADNQPVVLKMLNQTYPPPEKIAWFKREYERTKNLNPSPDPGHALQGVVAAYSLETNQQRWVIVLEDFGGESLNRLGLTGKLTLSKFLPLAIQITDILGQVHQRHIMHKDVNPSNIVLNPTTGQLKFIDFGISTALTRENPTLRNPNVLEGTLAYISPEQTGRMNRAIDYRTDFYSLGVTFYELLTGQLPFSTADAMELVHSHIATPPIPPHELRPDIPQPVSDIVLKLMAKNAEDRYQSAYGLKADLEECLRQWRIAERIDPFPLAQHDISDRFQISQKLYGRQQEIDTLLAAFERVSQGSSELMLVSGYSGIGKSALVQEIYKPITWQRGYFIAGKFDQFQRDIPYASLVQAFRSLIRQLLTESEREIETWREKLLAALGPNGQVIIDVIPEVELIIGPQPEVPLLGIAEAQNRFNLVFQNFIHVFTKAEHPLVLFLDDLQWADGASLKLLKLLMTASDSPYLFVIGAYRDNEVSQTHPLMVTLAEIRQVGARVNDIVLGPLNLFHVNQLIADTLNCSPERAKPLAELVLAKTGGNPFFLNEFLKSLHTEELLTFLPPSSDSEGGWQWDLAQIQGQDITDNVVELMAQKVQRLAEQTQQVLKLAACTGNQFDLQTLAVVYEKSPRETAIALGPAIAEGLILPLDEAYKLVELEVEGLTEEVSVVYKFAHDRIQQAAYSLIPEADKQAVHRRVGQLLLRNTPPDKREEVIFDIVNQLNLGGEPQPQAERDELAELNLLAGKKAKAAAAYQPAFHYLKFGLGLINPPRAAQDEPLHLNGTDSWERRYDLTLLFHLETAEASYLSGNYEQMEQLTGVVLQHAKLPLDKVAAYDVKIQARTGNMQFFEALQMAQEVLALLGVEFPPKPTFDDVFALLGETQAALAGQPIEALYDLPEMTDPLKLAAMRIMNSVNTAAYIAGPELYSLLVLKQLNLSLQYGNARESAFVYGSYAIILCGVVGDIDSGYQFGQLALRLMERFNAKEYTAKLCFIYNIIIRHWKEHLRVTVQGRDGYQSGLETGDLVFGSYCAFLYCISLYFTGRELALVEREMAAYTEAVAQLNQQLTVNFLKIYRQSVLNLINPSGDPGNLTGEIYNEAEMLPFMLEVNDRTSLFYVYLNKMIPYYLFQDYRQALENAPLAEQYSGGVIGSLYIPIFYLYDSLIRLAIFPDADNAEQEQLLEKVNANQEKMKTWAGHGPMNYLHKYYLVEAERARVLGQDGAAREYYDKAIDLAQENEFLSEEALAYELAGKFYLLKGQTRLAQHYLRDAHYAYRRWGATAKVKDLEARYPQFLIQAEARSRELATSTTPTTDTGETASSILDLASVLKASQAISGEIMLDRLLEKLMKIVIENAGAQRGYLVLEEEGRWVVEAEARVEAKAEAEIKALQSAPVLTQVGNLSHAIINYVARTRENVVLNDAAHEGLFTQDPYIVQRQPKSILCAPLINQGKLNGMLYLENNLATGAFTPDRLEVLNILSAQAAISIENARLYTRQVELTQAASRFVPFEFLRFLQKENIVKVKLGDQVQQNMTILVSDIRSFTTLSEKMTPQENFDFVNAYLSRVSPIIRQHRGSIAKYMGDGLMAVFPDRVEDALDAAIAQLQEVARYNLDRQQQGEGPIQIGIGIHTGPVMLGTVGEVQRMQMDLLSDAVNVTTRLEGLSKLYGVAMVISTEVLSQIQEPTRYHIRFLGKTPVKGRQEMISVFEVFDGDPAEVIGLKLQTKTAFEEGLSRYHEGEFAEAKIYFEQVLQSYPDDKAAHFYLQRIADFSVQGIPAETVVE